MRQSWGEFPCKVKQEKPGHGISILKMFPKHREEERLCALLVLLSQCPSAQISDLVCL